MAISRKWSGGSLAAIGAIGVVALAVAGGSALSADLFGPRSQELRDGFTGVLQGGDHFQDFLGAAVVSGDFNGDGRTDIAAYDQESFNAMSASGGVHVVYGGVDGLSGDDDQLWYEFDPATLLLDRQASAGFGSTLAVGDWNGDNRDDLAIGVPFRDIAGTFNAGWVVVIYGSEFGLQTDIGTPARRFRLGTGGIGGAPIGVDDRMGWALAAGDFDGSGVDDLAIGIPGKMVNLFDDAGSVLVLYGSATGLSSTNHRFFDQDSSDASGSMLGVAGEADRFGSSFAAGDFDDDGEDDLAIGAPFDDVAGAAGTLHGQVHVVYGALVVGLQLTANQLWTQNNIDTGESAEPSDFFGKVLASGDLSGDGIDDLVIGAPNEDFEGVVNVADAGEVTVLYGQPVSGITTLLSESYFESDFSAVGGAVQAFDLFGAALAIGDFERSAFDTPDLAIGIPQDNPWNGFQNQDDAGSVIVTRQHGIFLGGVTDRRWAQGYEGSAGLLVPQQAYGAALAAGDFDGDGFGDLAVGAPDFGTGVSARQGAIYTLYGAMFSDGFESADTSRWSATAP